MQIEKYNIDNNSATFFIADIGANHDGDINRAKDLIFLAKEAGAHAVKFQHFEAKTIVSDFGFKNLKSYQSHQSSWKKSVFEVYKDASIDLNWTEELVNTCKKEKIIFFTTPYSIKMTDHIDPFVSAYKIGSGDITYHQLIEYIAKKQKPYILATGASTINDVVNVVNSCKKINNDFAILQCNTNYTGSIENFKYVNLNVLKTYLNLFPGVPIGLSDHTPGHTTVLGAVSLGAKIIEKHFTDNTNRTGPDHHFAMDPKTWSEMMYETKNLEHSLGSKIKKIEMNEKETVVVQRRCIRLSRDLKKGQKVSEEDIIMLRPCPKDGITPFEMSNVIGKTINTDKFLGDYLKWKEIK